MTADNPSNGVSEKTKRPMPTTKELEELYRHHPLTEDTTCGIGVFRGPWFQKFSNEKAYVCIYGFLGCMFSACFSYFNGTITTVEKRFKIPSRISGMIMVGNDFSSLVIGLVLSYYAGKKHRPRWMGAGIFTVVIYCVLTALPHFIYGSGEDALALTAEYGRDGLSNRTVGSFSLEKDIKKSMCNVGNATEDGCRFEKEGANMPAIIFFTANFIAGIGGALYHTIGMSYMDDNIEKHKIPFLISLSHFLRLLGPAIGYSLASLSLEFFISPTLTPLIGTKDPRWLGAWWSGWILLGCVMFLFGVLLSLFPKTLPDAAVRKMVANEKRRLMGAEPEKEHEKPSFKDMIATFRRLLTNKPYMSIQISHIIYIFGYMPYWIFMPKYIETQYRRSASFSSLITGTVGLVFSALGILMSGAVITKVKPKARTLAAWNLLIVGITAFGIASYAFLGCPETDTYGNLKEDGLLSTNFSCNKDCNCEQVKYTPVCSQDGAKSYISPCHAGCTGEKLKVNGSEIYTNCACVAPTSNLTKSPLEGFVSSGACASDCSYQFMLFVSIVCLLKFIGSTSRASNFLVGIRSARRVSLALQLFPASIFLSTNTILGGGYIRGSVPTFVWRDRGKTPLSTLDRDYNPNPPVNCEGDYLLRIFSRSIQYRWVCSILMLRVPHIADVSRSETRRYPCALLCVFTFIPSPIFFGYLIGEYYALISTNYHNKTCMVWGKTCSGTGNCWIYNTENMRNLLNFTAAGRSTLTRAPQTTLFVLTINSPSFPGCVASLIMLLLVLSVGSVSLPTLTLSPGFIAVGALVDVTVWYYVKDVKIFDEEVELEEVNEVEAMVDATQEKLLTEAT
uniref:Solute carrier organic anion transporter family member n=1 Tax=Timema monikensis TaxID=170555 RepID=A0A7R9HRH1_9NEOP|nr:unnamed protein product [Timema monikensis]